jgi:hypothetical protein
MRERGGLPFGARPANPLRACARTTCVLDCRWNRSRHSSATALPRRKLCCLRGSPPESTSSRWPSCNRIYARRVYGLGLRLFGDRGLAEELVGDPPASLALVRSLRPGPRHRARLHLHAREASRRRPAATKVLVRRRRSPSSTWTRRPPTGPSTRSFSRSTYATCSRPCRPSIARCWSCSIWAT